MSSLRPRVLVIDDEPQIHRFLRPALEANGYEMIAASSGAEGLAALAMRPPDAVVLDLGLPDLDGQEVLVRARALFDGPILILSARDREPATCASRLRPTTRPTTMSKSRSASAS